MQRLQPSGFLSFQEVGSEALKSLVRKAEDTPMRAPNTPIMRPQKNMQRIVTNQSTVTSSFSLRDYFSPSVLLVDTGKKTASELPHK